MEFVRKQLNDAGIKMIRGFFAKNCKRSARRELLIEQAIQSAKESLFMFEPINIRISSADSASGAAVTLRQSHTTLREQKMDQMLGIEPPAFALNNDEHIDTKIYKLPDVRLAIASHLRVARNNAQGCKNIEFETIESNDEPNDIAMRWGNAPDLVALKISTENSAIIFKVKIRLAANGMQVIAYAWESPAKNHYLTMFEFKKFISLEGNPPLRLDVILFEMLKEFENDFLPYLKK
jgi:hypothetical protein